ncbi:DUF3987 domain-containing protein [Xylanibacter ruminicola]|uniref:DUF3987 domain-containing protein n=1 Tax=Xylanibacter ruminicola TaxID=839 RepID=UPI0009B89EC3
MNYSCLPNEDDTLKGSTRMSTTVGMDIDHLSADEMPAIRERILSKKDELGLLMLEESARGGGYHLVFARKSELSQEENLKWASNLISVAYDSGAKDITRVFFTTSGNELIYLDDAIFELEEVLGTDDTDLHGLIKSSDDNNSCNSRNSCQEKIRVNPCRSALPLGSSKNPCQNTFKGIAYKDIIAEFWRRTGGVPNTGERNKRLHQLAANLRSICDDSEEWLLALMPNLGLPDHEMRSIIHSACKEPTKGSRLMDQIVAALATSTYDTIDTDDQQLSIINSQLSIKKLPQGVKDSVAAVGPELAMPIITAVCPCIGALATGVKLDVHGRVRGLNLISYIVGEFASRKGDIDPVVDAWMSEVSAMDEMYQQQEDEYRRKKRASKNKKEQPEEIELPVRYIALNNTVANLAERLANVEGKHAFSFTPEADTVAQKWRSAMSDFSVLLRQSYDGSRYDREAKSAEAVNVHIKHLLWNVVMCGTPDALYRVVTNYTDGFQSRIALSQTPDNTYAKLEDKPYVLTDRQTERIQQVAHLLPLMAGEVVLQKLEARGRAWLEKIRLEAMMNDDRVKARERFRTCVTAQRMVCCLMLCKVCEQLIQKHGLNGAETQLKQKPYLWKEMLQKTQTPAMLDMYDVIADQLLDSALYYFRDRIENAYRSRDYAASNSRSRRSKNDTIYERLDVQFSFDQAMQFSVAIKGADVTRNSVQQMLKNWRKQGLVSLTDDGGYRKVS